MSSTENKLIKYKKLHKSLKGSLLVHLKNDQYWLKAALILGTVPALAPIAQIQAQCVSSTLLNNAAVPDNDDAGITIDLDGGGPDFRFVERAANEGTLYLEGIGGAQVLGVYFGSFPNTVVPNNYALNAPITTPTGGNEQRNNGFLFYSNGLGPWGTGTTSGYIGIAKGGQFGFIEVEITATLTPPNTTNIYDFFVTVTNGGFDVGVPGNVLAGDCATLPVVLSEFTAIADKGEVILEWKTESEITNSGFLIERSMDGKNFDSVGFVEGNGTSSRSQNYQFTDQHIKSNVVYLYRLKQVDHNGRFEYSDIISVEFTEDFDDIGEIFPNPGTEVVSINIEASERTEIIEVQIFNSSAQLIKKVEQNLEVGNNLMTFKTADWETGMYFMKLTKAGQPYYRKFVVK